MADKTDMASTMDRLLVVLSRMNLEFQGRSYALKNPSEPFATPTNWAAQLRAYRTHPPNQSEASRPFDVIREAIQRGESIDASLPILVAVLERMFPPMPSSRVTR
jgi:hypothetical protein